MSVLSIMPRKEDDGSEYRCTVWNRAIEESELMEASTTIDVNCKYMAPVHLSVYLYVVLVGEPLTL
jgi:hypothetical protein